MNPPSGPVANYVREALELFAGYGSTEAIVYGDRRLTYADLHGGVLRLAASLREHGVEPGAAVAVLAGNQPDAVLAQFALHLLGCRSVWVARAPLAHQVDYLRQAHIDAFLYQVDTHGDLGRELARQVAPGRVFGLGPGGVGPDLLAVRPEPPPHIFDDVTTEPESLFQTSGTTGRPKLVHHRNALFQAFLRLAAAWAADGRPTRHLNYAAFWHVSSQLGVMYMLFTGGTLVMREDFDAGEFLSIIEREGITTTNGTPPRLYELLDDPMLGGTDLSSLRMLTVGGSNVAPARLAQALTQLGPVVRVAYGMSEAPLITELNADEHDRARPGRLTSCGRAYGGGQVAIRDASGATLAPGGAGQVWVSGPLVMAGYWGQPELTAQTLVDGWLRTGDVGYLDEDGYLYLVGREKDRIVTGVGSTNVYPGPIEDVLAAHPQVRDAAVIGVPDDALGEAVYAFVVPAPGATVTSSELRDLVVAKLNTIWAPRTVELVESLPLLGWGKVDKRALRSRYLARQSEVRA